MGWWKRGDARAAREICRNQLITDEDPLSSFVITQVHMIKTHMSFGEMRQGHCSMGAGIRHICCFRCR